LFLITNLIGPSDFGVGGIFLVLITIYVLCFLILVLGSRLLEKVIITHSADKTVSNIYINRLRRRSLLISAALAFAPLLLISMNSLGNVQIWYVVLVVLFECVAIFFIIKRA